MTEGKPTGLKREDVSGREAVEFEGRPVHFFGEDHDAGGRVRLELETPGGSRVALYGYFGRGGEFFETDRERLS